MHCLEFQLWQGSGEGWIWGHSLIGFWVFERIGYRGKMDLLPVILRKGIFNE